jgi:hypothetical protein
MGIHDRPTAPRSPWQNGHTERLIGSIRRECLDHVIVFGERRPRHVLLSYMKYYNGARTHLSLNKDARYHELFRPSGAFCQRQFLADYTTNMFGFDFRQGQAFLPRWRFRVISFARPTDPKFVLGLLYKLLCLLKVGGQRVKESLAVLFNVNLMIGHGFDYDAGLFHGRQYAPRFLCVPKNRFCNIDGEGRLGQVVRRRRRGAQSRDGEGRP